MNEIYIPNIFRRENIRVLPDGSPVTDIPYFVDFDLHNDKQLSAMLTYQLSIIIEHILLFDRVYVDIMDFPVIVNQLYELDANQATTILKNGYISFINSDDIIISIHKRNAKYFITHSGRKMFCSNIDEFRENVLAICPEAKIKLEPYLNQMLKYCKYIQYDVKELGIKMVHLVDKEIREGAFSKYGIGLNGNYIINDNNKGVFDVICQVIRDETLGSILNIENIYHDDITLELFKCRLTKFYSIDDDFKSLMNIHDIPDLRMIFLEGLITLQDIVALRNSPEYHALKKVIFQNNKDNGDVVKSFYQAVIKKSRLDILPMKTLRFIATNALGLINPGVGLIAGALDGFGLDLIKGITPNVFFDKLNKKINKNQRSDDREVEHIAVSLRKDIVIDLEDERKLDDICANLMIISQQILDVDTEEKAISLYNESCDIYKKYQILNTFIPFISCAVNLSSISKQSCYEFIFKFEKWIKELQYQDVKEGVEVLYRGYVQVLCNGFSYNLDSDIIPRLKSLIKEQQICREMILAFIDHIKDYEGRENKMLINKLNIILE